MDIFSLLFSDSFGRRNSRSFIFNQSNLSERSLSVYVLEIARIFFVAAMATCANPGCDQPGTNKCSGCKTTPYCGPICQTVHWTIHKEFCDGRLRKMGMTYLEKARDFHRVHNWSQLLRYSELAATKLKQLKDRPIEDISTALNHKCAALGFLSQYREQLECAKEWYCLWNTKPTDVGAICAAFALIESCIQNNEYVDAHLYASTLNEIINHKYDNKIPEDQRQRYIAKGAYFLALATLRLAQDGGIPPGEKQKAGVEVIALARRALEIHTQLYGTEDNNVAGDTVVLADALNVFINDGDDEILRLYEQAIAIYTRVYGSSSVNAAVSEGKLAAVFYKRAEKVRVANDLDRELANLKMALTHIRESSRIYQATARVDDANRAAQLTVVIEERLRQLAIATATAAATRG